MAEVDQKLIDVKPKQMLDTLTEEYAPAAHSSVMVNLTRNRPPFTRLTIRQMIADPRIIYGLWLLKGPLISKGPRRKEQSKKPQAPPSPFQMAFPPEKKGTDNVPSFMEKGDHTTEQPKQPTSSFSGGEIQGCTVLCDRSDVQKFIEDNLVRFWRTEAIKALTSLEWGYSGSESLYRLKDGYLHFDKLKQLDAGDVSPVRHRGKLVGMYVQSSHLSTASSVPRTYIGGPKAFWHVHWRDRDPWWGVSRLFGAHVPWWEKWCDGGFRDARRLWFYKNAFDGGTIYHPVGSTRLDSGAVVANKDLARELIEKKRSGGVLTLPNIPSGDGAGRAWEHEQAQANPVPAGLLEYGESLDAETLESLGIPPEVIESSGNQGFGSSTGRQVPQEAFECILQELIQWLIYDFDMQVLRFLVALNFVGGADIDYEIIPTPIGEQGGANIASNQANDYHGNQFQEQDGNAKDQDQIDAEKGNRQKKSKTPKSLATAN